MVLNELIEGANRLLRAKSQKPGTVEEAISRTRWRRERERESLVLLHPTVQLSFKPLFAEAEEGENSEDSDISLSHYLHALLYPRAKNGDKTVFKCFRTRQKYE